MLVFDQFEEVLTVDPFNVEMKKAFFAELAELFHERGRWGVLAMREDYLAGLDNYARMMPTHLSNTFRLNLLGYDAALEAIKRSAKPDANAPGVIFAPGVAEALADDLRKVRHVESGVKEEPLGPFIEPVQLQVVCLRVWDLLPDGSTEIAAQDVKKAGDVEGALQSYYSATVADVAAQTRVTERTVRDWFETLITKQGTRGQVVHDASQRDGINAEALSLLVDSHLTRSDQRLGAVWYELAHDRLIQPVVNSNDAWSLINLRPFQRDAEAWAEQKRPKDRLLRGESLAIALEEASGRTLTADEQAFLDESKEQDTARLREIRQAKINKFWAIGASVAAVFALAAAIYAFNAKQRELTARQREDAARKDAIAANAEVVTAKEEAKRLIKAAQERADALYNQAVDQAAEQSAILAKAAEERSAALKNVMAQTPIENVVDEKSAPGEVKSLNNHWTSLVLGTGADGVKRTTAIAREYGKGRILCIGHNQFWSYSNAGGNLFLNTALQWANGAQSKKRILLVTGTEGTGNSSTEGFIKYANGWGYQTVMSRDRNRIEVSELGHSSIVLAALWYQTPSPAEIKALQQFVEDGGGLIVSGYGWVWRQYGDLGKKYPSADKSEFVLDAYPDNQLMKSFGARWTGEIARMNLK